MTGDNGSSSLSSDGGGVTMASSRMISVTSLLMKVLEGEIWRPSRSNQGPGVLGTVAFGDAWYSSSAENLRKSKGDNRDGLLTGDDCDEKINGISLKSSKAKYPIVKSIISSAQIFKT